MSAAADLVWTAAERARIGAVLRSWPEPVLLRSTAERRSGMARRWSLAALTGRVGDRRVQVAVSPRPRFDYSEAGERRFAVRTVPFSEAMTLILSTPPFVYMRQLPLARLTSAFRFEAAGDLPALPGLKTIWIGSSGTVTPLHNDGFNTLFVQLWGTKRFYLFPPTEYERMRPLGLPTPRPHVCRLDPKAEPDSRPIILDVGPGDVLFLPAFWWHQVEALTIGASLSGIAGIQGDQLEAPAARDARALAAARRARFARSPAEGPRPGGQRHS